MQLNSADILPGMPLLVVGAGISGATLARQLAEAGQRIVVIDERAHIGGNCHTERDGETGILVHRYGPHIFHTDNDNVWTFLSRFAEFVPYRHKVFATVGNQVFRLPINLHTLGQFFGQSFSPDKARAFLADRVTTVSEPSNFEDLARATVGDDLYAAFFRGYTKKQWGRDPAEIPASVFKRLPVNFDFDDNYFHHSRQAMPRDGYTEMIRRMLDHDLIETRLNTAFSGPSKTAEYGHIFHTGAIDRFFEYRFGMLDYRTLDFEEVRADADLLGTSVMNFCDEDVPHTRITEHKHLAPWSDTGPATIAYIERARQAVLGDILYYPVRLADDQQRLNRYQLLAAATPGVTFFGRLGAYAYLDMDKAVEQAMELSSAVIQFLKR